MGLGGLRPTSVLPGRVLSSQFLVLCKRHPSLVVELAKELLEFVGGGSGVPGDGHVLTSVVSLGRPSPTGPGRPGRG